MMTAGTGLIYCLCISPLVSQSVFNSGKILTLRPCQELSVDVSVSQLGKLISVEKLFLQELEQHADQLRTALANIEGDRSNILIGREL